MNSDARLCHACDRLFSNVRALVKHRPEGAAVLGPELNAQRCPYDEAGMRARGLQLTQGMHKGRPAEVWCVA